MLAPCGRQALQRGRLDVHRMPGHVQLRGQAGAGAHDLLAVFPRSDAGQQRLAVGPHRLHRALAPVGLHLVVDAIGGAAQRQLAQREQVALAEEVRHRPLGLLRQVDLAGTQARQQLVGRQVDDDHLVGLVEEPIGHGLPDTDAGDAADDVVQALQVLHVHRRPDVDTRVEQFLDVLPAFRVARARRVAVRQFVQQHQAVVVVRAEGQRGIEVELLQHAVAVGHGLQRQARQVARHDLGLGAAVGLDEAHHQRRALGPGRPRGGQHRVGLADAGGGTEEDLQPAAPRARLVMLHLPQQRVGIGARINHRGWQRGRAGRRAAPKPARCPSGDRSSYSASEGPHHSQPVRRKRQNSTPAALAMMDSASG